MKPSELKKLIHEEIQNILKEKEYSPSYLHMKPYIKSIKDIMISLKDINNKIEDKGPLSEEIEDAYDILEELIQKIKQK